MTRSASPHPRRLPRRGRAVPLATAALLLALATGCSGEEEVVDDGTVGADVATLEQAGLTVLSGEQPARASGAEVVGALEDEALGAEVLEEDDDAASAGLALDPAQAAGLLTTVVGGEGDRMAVLVFDDPASAQVFALDEPVVFARGDARRTAYFSGSLVAYYAPGDGTDRIDALERALESISSPESP